MISILDVRSLIHQNTLKSKQLEREKSFHKSGFMIVTVERSDYQKRGQHISAVVNIALQAV